MPSYTCKLCNFETTFRRNYTRHLKTKKHLTNENIWNNKKSLQLNIKDLSLESVSTN